MVLPLILIFIEEYNLRLANGFLLFIVDCLNDAVMF